MDTPNGVRRPTLISGVDVAVKLDDASERADRLRAPSYDRSRLERGVAHFGVGNFHRVHQASYIARCRARPGSPNSATPDWVGDASFRAAGHQRHSRIQNVNRRAAAWLYCFGRSWQR